MTQINHVGTPREKKVAACKSDATLSALLAGTPDEIDAWMDDNVVSFIDVRDLLKSVIKQLSIMAEQE